MESDRAGYQSLFSATVFDSDQSTITALNVDDLTIASSIDVSGATITGIETGDVIESSNLYYTESRFDSRLATKTTDDLSEGLTNLYFTDLRVQDNTDVKSNTTHRGRTDNPHTVTPAQLGITDIGSGVIISGAERTQIGTNTSNISTNTADISTNTADISTNTADIKTNASDISTNTSNISTNASDITGKVSKSGDTMTGTLTLPRILTTNSSNSTPSEINQTSANTNRSQLNILNEGRGTSAGDWTAIMRIGSVIGARNTGLISWYQYNDANTDNKLGLGVGGVSFESFAIRADDACLVRTKLVAPDIYGSESTGGSLNLHSTSNATKGQIICNDELNVNGNKIVNVGTPTATTDATNKTYVDTEVKTNADAISTNASDISTNTSNISTNTSNISTNTSNISTNTSDITGKVSKSGDTMTGALIAPRINTNNSPFSNPCVIDTATTNSTSTLLRITNTGNSLSAGNWTGQFALGSAGSARNEGTLNWYQVTNGSTSNRIGIGIHSVSYDTFAVRADDYCLVRSNLVAPSIYGSESPSGDLNLYSTSHASKGTIICNDNLNLNSNKITNLATPTATTDATNKSYVDTEVKANADDIKTNADDIKTNAGDISLNAGDIFTNTSNISTNTSNISTNATNITGKVSKSGDTMTGNLSLGTNYLTTAGAFFTSTSNGYLYFPTGGTLNIQNGASASYIYLDDSKTEIKTYQTIRPNANNANDLGTSSYGFKDLFLAGDIYGENIFPQETDYSPTMGDSSARNFTGGVSIGCYFRIGKKCLW